MINSHYVPMQTLRKFGEKLCLFNVRDQQYHENANIKKLFSQKGFYTDEVEDKLNKKVESQFGNLFANKIISKKEKIELSREEVYLIKKFLLISVIRSLGNEEFMQKEKAFYSDLQNYWMSFARNQGMSEEEARENMPHPPFEEKIIENETPFDYWMRTINVILDTNGTPQDILKHKNKTFPAYRWAEVINSGYLGFWDSSYETDEFVITDIGMTSENEKGWNGITVHNTKKTDFLFNLLKQEKDKAIQMDIIKFLKLHSSFSENFMMFPISAKRMIVEIDPFFRFREMYKPVYDMPSLNLLTEMANEELFYPNDCKYVLPQNGISPLYNPGDKYIYKIKKLSPTETRYCNVLFLDRINTYLGFSSLDKIAPSILMYKNLTSYPYMPRVDYTGLYKVINDRLKSNFDFPTNEKSGENSKKEEK